MTDEERQKLCAQLREYSFQEAADEIERLEKEVAHLKELMFDMEIPDR